MDRVQVKINSFMRAQAPAGDGGREAGRHAGGRREGEGACNTTMVVSPVYDSTFSKAVTLPAC